MEDKKNYKLQVFSGTKKIIIAYLHILSSVHIGFFCINQILSSSAIGAKICDTKLAYFIILFCYPNFARCMLVVALFCI